MTLLPVIERELGTQARLVSTYIARGVAVAAMLAVSLFASVKMRVAPGQGLWLFGWLHWAVFLSIWCFVPLMTADCLSREKREGTLGLLFLTPLRAWEVVVAKGLVHGLRGVMLLLAALPVAVLPILLGGVDGKQVLIAFGINAASLALALAAGLLASAWSQRWGRALSAAGLLALLFYFGWWLANLGGVAQLMWRGYISSLWDVIRTGLEFFVNGSRWVDLLDSAALAKNTATVAYAGLGSAALAVSCLGSGIFLAAISVRRSTRESEPSAWRRRCEKEFVSPIYWQGLLRRWLRRTLERNPVGWLERRTWTGRTVLWVWLTVLGTMWFGELTSCWGRLLDFQGQDVMLFLAWILAGTLAVSAAGSFGRERESGVMELLLVTPLGERRIIYGRWQGLQGQFLPAGVLLLGLWLYAALQWEAKTVWFWFFAITFATLPVTGLYFSLRCRHRVHALAWTLGMGLLLPLLLNELVLPFSAWLQSWQARRPPPGLTADFVVLPHIVTFQPLLRDVPAIISTTLVPMILQILLAVALGFALHRNLRRRAFAFQRT